MGSTRQTADGKASSGRFHNTILYVKQHWQLYVFFLGPALVLTLIFKYGPMGGILIAFQKYNPIKGILGSKWVGFKYFKQFLSCRDGQKAHASHPFSRHFGTARSIAFLYYTCKDGYIRDVQSLEFRV